MDENHVTTQNTTSKNDSNLLNTSTVPATPKNILQSKDSTSTELKTNDIIPEIIHKLNKEHKDCKIVISNNLNITTTNNNHDDMKHDGTVLRNSVIMRQLTPMTNDRTDRCHTMIRDVSDTLDLTKTDEKQEIFEYGFGTPFSYWPEYTYYEYVAPKYESLKVELLNNEICAVSLEDWQQIMIRAETKHQIIHNILGHGADKNTAFAHFNEQYNALFNISHEEKISLAHILSILFYTDLTNLPREMKGVCRKLDDKETMNDVAQRHSELVHWLRLLFETIVLYGNAFGTMDNECVYHGLNKKFYFREFKAKFYIPTSATTEISIAQNFAEGNGIILEFGALETFGDPYFDTASLSAYPEEKEYLFFFAELSIKRLIIEGSRFDMAPLSLYQSIVSGNIMIDKIQSDKKHFNKTQKKLAKFLNMMDEDEDEEKEKDDVEEYGRDLLKRFIKHNTRICINTEEIAKKITLKTLKEKFILQNDDKSFNGYAKSLLDMQQEIKNSECFTWNNSRDDIENVVLSDGSGYCCSSTFKCKDRSKFYCQMNRMTQSIGRISLILYKLKGKQEKTVSFDFYCKSMKSFYVRFHRITFKLGGKDEDCRQGADFSLPSLKKAYDKGKEIVWKITINE